MFNYYPSRHAATLAIGLIAALGSIALLTLQGNGTITASYWYSVPGVVVVAYWLLSRLITDAVREGNRLSMIDMMLMQGVSTISQDDSDDDDGDSTSPETLNADTFRKAVTA